MPLSPHSTTITTPFGQAPHSHGWKATQLISPAGGLDCAHIRAPLFLPHADEKPSVHYGGSNVASGLGVHLSSGVGWRVGPRQHAVLLGMDCGEGLGNQGALKVGNLLDIWV